MFTTTTPQRNHTNLVLALIAARLFSFFSFASWAFNHVNDPQIKLKDFPYGYNKDSVGKIYHWKLGKFTIVLCKSHNVYNPLFSTN